MKKKDNIRKITMTAIFVSIAVILRVVFPLNVPLFGHEGIRFGFSGIFTSLAAILGGPIFGAAASALTDIIAFIIKPTGTYLFPMLLVLILGGLLRGYLWLVLKNRNAKNFRLILMVFASLVTIFGLSNAVLFNLDGINSDFFVNNPNYDIDSLSYIGEIIISRTQALKDPSASINEYILILTYGVISIGLIAFSMIIIDFFATKYLEKRGMKSYVLPLMITIIVSGIFVTTVNTLVLRETIYTGWKELPFLIIWLPRAIEELLSSALEIYALAIMINVYERIKK